MSKYAKRGAYHWAAYEDASGAYRKHVDEVVGMAGDPGRDGARALDVGAGDGLISNVLRSRGFDVVAFDHDERACELAREKGVDVIRHRAETPFPGRFDVGILSESINEFDDPEGVLKWLRGSCGRLVLSVPKRWRQWSDVRSMLWRCGWSARAPVMRDGSAYVVARPLLGTIFTAAFGPAGEIPRVDPSVPCRLVAWSDRFYGWNLNEWEVRLDNPAAYRSDRLANRHWKILGHEGLGGVTAYVDGRVEVLPRFADLFTLPEEFSIPRHPELDCLYQELRHEGRLNKQPKEVLEALRARYRAAGVPENAGVFQAMVLVRRPVYWVARFCRAWWKEILDSGSERDQAALCAVSRLSAPRPSRMMLNAWANDFWRVRRKVGKYVWG